MAVTRLQAISVAAAICVAWAGAAAAESGLCADPGAFCTKSLNATCLERLGAGAIAATDDGCAAQLAAYRDCLAQAATACDAETATEAPPPARAKAAKDVDIREAQRELTRLGYYEGPIDGVWSAETEEAVRRFKLEAGVVPPNGDLTNVGVSEMKRLPTP